MSKHKAIIVGCGRIGVGRNWIETPYVYTHAGAYAALRDRVELIGFVDPDEAARKWATEKHGLPSWATMDEMSEWCDGNAPERRTPDIYSISTPPSQRAELMEWMYQDDWAKGIWCEKPYGLTEFHKMTNELEPIKIQVNYIRRADPYHKWVASSVDKKGLTLRVEARINVHTVCHFTDLARWWRVPLKYEHHDGPNAYFLEGIPGGKSLGFAMGGIPDGSPFMVNMLGNLLDSVEGRADLISPPESAIESEKWANEILKGLA